MDDSGGGHGTVVVSVSLDPSALAAIGGQAALAAQLKDTDLVDAGWRVTEPAAGIGSSTVITASHPFSSPAQAGALVADLAGNGSQRPFQLNLATHHSFWRTSTSLTGRVNLTCGLDCFGDSGLKAATGSTAGVDAGPLEKSSGEQPDQVFGFSVLARLPGSVNHTNAASHLGGRAEWTPHLGQTLDLTATTEALNWTRVIAAAVVVGLIVVVPIVVLIRRRWRRRGPRGLHRKGAGQKEAVASEA